MTVAPIRKRKKNIQNKTDVSAPHGTLGVRQTEFSQNSVRCVHISLFFFFFIISPIFFNLLLMDYAEEEELPIVQCAQRAEASIAISPSLVFQRGFLQNQITTSWKYHRPEHICFHKMDFESLQRNGKTVETAFHKKKEEERKNVLSSARSLTVKSKNFCQKKTSAMLRVCVVSKYDLFNKLNVL